MHKVIYYDFSTSGLFRQEKGSDVMVLMDEEKARLEGEDSLPGEDAPITWDEDYMQGKEMRSLLYCSAQLYCVSLETFSTQDSMCAK